MVFHLTSLQPVSMGLVADIAFSEPTFFGQCGAALFHMLLWIFLGDYDWGLMGIIERWFKSQPWWSTVQKNYKDDASQKVYNYDDPGDNLTSLVKTAFHHGWGGMLMLVGMVTGQPWLWRHGMLTEVGGLDVLEFVMILQCKLFPPGKRPFRDNLKSPTYMGLVIFHHSVGLCVGIPVNMYFADIFQFQLFGLVVLGGPSLCCLLSVFIRTFDLEKHPGLDLLNHLQMLIIFAIMQRTLYYFPAAWFCIQEVWRSPVCTWAIFLPFVYAVVAMSLFNLIVLAIMAGALKDTLFGKTPEAKAEGRRRLCRSASMGLSASDFNSGLVGTSERLTTFFVASKMVGLAETAKKRVSKHD